ncbi:MAG: hypothetical protein IPO59_20395 [Betaproteobacteria bacterium]|nr:hypothetical protein [Betaproteobacteria bacterium]
MIEGVEVFPVTVMADGFGRLRAAQVNGCSFAEMRSALLLAQQSGVEHFVIVSHNFDMLRSGSTAPDWTVVRRFEALCRFLAERKDLCMSSLSDHPLPTARRWAEQALRRVVAR